MLSWLVSLTVFFVSKAIMSLKTSLAGAATAIGLAALAYPAQAALYNFTYDNGIAGANNITVTGTLIGNPGSTPGTIDVDAFSNLVVNGVSLDTGDWTFGTTSVSTYDDFIGGTATPPGVANLNDPSGQNFVLLDTNGSDYIAFGPGQVSLPGQTVFASSFSATPSLAGTPADLQGDEQAFGAMGWTLQPVGVPEPGSVVALLGLGLGALASRVRKQG